MQSHRTFEQTSLLGACQFDHLQDTLAISTYFSANDCFVLNIKWCFAIRQNEWRCEANQQFTCQVKTISKRPTHQLLVFWRFSSKYHTNRIVSVRKSLIMVFTCLANCIRSKQIGLAYGNDDAILEIESLQNL